MQTMDMGGALQVLRQSGKVARLGWNGKGLWVELQVPDAFSKMTQPYAFLNYPASSQWPAGQRIPWVPSQSDLLAEDWIAI
jgi:hypothetical protein